MKQPVAADVPDESFRYPREELAAMLAKEMLGQASFGLLAPLPISGTFLSAPRRVGKSTFLRDDLAPVFEAQGHLVVYIDLWAHRDLDPGVALRNAFYSALEQKAGRLAKATKALGLSKVTALSAVSFDLTKNAPTDSTTFTQLLTQLADKSKTKKVVLIVDEAQHALMSTSGENAMYALKAARDALNSSIVNARLILLCTGSSRSKLSALVTGKQSPFLGAVVRDFPPLGADFTKAYSDFVSAKLQAHLRFRHEVMQQAFELLNYRPETLMSITGITVAATIHGGEDINQSLLKQAKIVRDGAHQEMQIMFDELTVTQQAVLLRLLDANHTGDNFAPFGKVSLQSYADYVGEPVSTTNAQSALDGLVQKDIVWQAKRGGYAVDDPLWMEWWLERAKA